MMLMLSACSVNADGEDDVEFDLSDCVGVIDIDRSVEEEECIGIDVNDDEEPSPSPVRDDPTRTPEPDEFNHDDCEVRDGYELDRDVEDACTYVAIVDDEPDEFNHDDCEVRDGYELDRDVEDACTYVAIVDDEPDQEPAMPEPVQQTGQSCQFPASGNLDDMPKTEIELASYGQWFHRVFNPHLFKAPDWGGADSWFVTLALGNHSGGAWTDHGNPGQIVYRGTSTHIQWCLGVLTSSQYVDQFLAGASGPVAINVRIAPNSVVTVNGPSGAHSQVTSDAGDITIILPDDGVVSITVDYTTAAPTHESLVWWGPYDRSENINTIDAR